GEQFRRAKDVERHVIGNGAHGDSGDDELQDDDENKNGGEKSAGGRKGERAENVVEQKLRAIADSLQAAGQILGRKGLRGGNANAHSQIRGRQIPGYAGQQHREFAIALQLFAAWSAGFQMLADVNALFYRSGAGHRVVQIASQLAVYLVALHGSSPVADCRCMMPAAQEARPARCSWDVSARADVSCWPSQGSKRSFSARRPRRMRDFTVPTLHSRTSAISS